MDDALLRADCARCAALCCVTLAFDRSDLFALDKAAGEPCPHLTGSDRCVIHAEREQRGFAGCAAYDCLGAGQRATGLFGGRSWQREPDLAVPMFEAFRALARIHEQLALLRTAQRLALTALQGQTLRELWDRLSPTEGWSLEALARFEESDLPAAVEGFLKSLRTVARGRRLPLIR